MDWRAGSAVVASTDPTDPTDPTQEGYDARMSRTLPADGSTDFQEAPSRAGEAHYRIQPVKRPRARAGGRKKGPSMLEHEEYPGQRPPLPTGLQLLHGCNDRRQSFKRSHSNTVGRGKAIEIEASRRQQKYDEATGGCLRNRSIRPPPMRSLFD
ncbi:MAG: hypothetical protein M1815_003288 [Lichina confinis]|nr:MAG: hypothetical protein M1815_003288 [Lichina confinis]